MKKLIFLATLPIILSSCSKENCYQMETCTGAELKYDSVRHITVCYRDTCYGSIECNLSEQEIKQLHDKNNYTIYYGDSTVWSVSNYRIYNEK
jgi:hypothetical protein